MLYLLKDNSFYKVGFTENSETLIKRIQAYKTHNPSFILLGLRQGGKIEEKEYHSFLSVERNSEWIEIKDDEVINSLIEDFSLDQKFLTKISENFLRLEDSDTVPEPLNIIQICERGIPSLKYFSGLYSLILTDKILFAFNDFTKEGYKLPISNIKIFFKDYGTDGKQISGFILEDKLIYSVRIARSSGIINTFYNGSLTEIPFIETGIITTIKDPIYNIIKPYIKTI